VDVGRFSKYIVDASRKKSGGFPKISTTHHYLYYCVLSFFLSFSSNKHATSHSTTSAKGLVECVIHGCRCLVYRMYCLFGNNITIPFFLSIYFGCVEVTVCLSMIQSYLRCSGKYGCTTTTTNRTSFLCKNYYRTYSSTTIYLLNGTKDSNNDQKRNSRITSFFSNTRTYGCWT